MKIEYSVKTNLFFAQAYGSDTYGAQQYNGCNQAANECVTTQAPNTGFLGLTPDAAIASGSGALLVAIAIAGAVTVVLRRRTHKNKA